MSRRPSGFSSFLSQDIFFVRRLFSRIFRHCTVRAPDPTKKTTSKRRVFFHHARTEQNTVRAEGAILEPAQLLVVFSQGYGGSENKRKLFLHKKERLLGEPLSGPVRDTPPLSSGERSFLCPEAPAGKLEPHKVVKAQAGPRSSWR